MLPSRASTVARVVPSLAQILSRAFTASATLSRDEGRTWSSQQASRIQRSESRRGPPSSTKTDRALRDTSKRVPWSERKPANDKPAKGDVKVRTTSQRLALPSTEAPESFGLHDKRTKEHRSQENVFQAKPRPFSAFELNSGLQAGLQEKFPDGETMPIQSLSLMGLLSEGPHRAVLAAETGSGKTLAYMLPLLHHLKETDQNIPRSSNSGLGLTAPRALVLAPTHELTRQSTRVAKGLTHTAKLSVIGGSSPGSTQNAGPIDVLFTTGRSAAWLLNLPREDRENSRAADRAAYAAERAARAAESTGKPIAEEKSERKRGEVLDLRRLEWLVIDEADVLLGPDFVDETAKVLERIQKAKPDINILLVTATLPPSLHRALETNPLLNASEFDHHLSPGLHRLPQRLETRFVPWSGGGNTLADIAHEIKRGFSEDAAEAQLTDDKTRSKAVVFCGSVPKVKSVAAMLENKEIKCLSWTGESTQRVPGRNGPLDSFLAGHDETEEQSTKGPRVLVTTSLLSRGLDFSPAVSTIYLLDPPRNVLDFVHRAGRAGRAGRHGRVVVFGVSHAGQIKYGEELRAVLNKTESRPASKLGGRTSKRWVRRG